MKKTTQKYWKTEIDASKKRLRKFHKSGDKVVDIFLGKRQDERGIFDLNLFNSNITVLTSLLYGNVPKIDVSRRYADADDDVARVASETMERMLNLDLSKNGADFDSVFESVLQDRLIVGLGVARVRYDVKTDDGKIQESAPIDYFHWRDVLWGWGRNFSDLPWIAFRSYLSREEFIKRFGQKALKGVDFKKQQVETEESGKDEETASPWDKAEVWEVWDKKNREVVWYHSSAQNLLDRKDDPLQLQSFYPCPKFMTSNTTTTLYIPKSDYKIAQDLYREINVLQERISIITKAVKVVGVYDQSADGIKRIFTEGTDNDLIPVENWAMFAEKGGLKGSIEWLPIAEVADTLNKLIQLRDDTIQMLQQITGMSDIMQGGLKNQYEGNAQSALKASFGSVRVQKMQEEFASFVSELMRIKAEIISRHFEPMTIATQSNMQTTVDAQMLPQAITLIKNPDIAQFKVEIKPESLAMTDFAMLKQERSDFINAVATFLQSSAPLIEQEPASKPFLMKILQWTLAGYKGSQEIEGVIDQTIQTLEQQAQQGQQEKPDPEQMKLQAQQQLEQMKLQGELQKIQAKMQSELQLRNNDMKADIQTAQMQHQAKMAEIQANMESKIAEERVKLEAALLSEKAQAASNIMQTNASAKAEITKSAVDGKINIEVEKSKTEQEINKIAASATADITKSEAQTVKETTNGEGK